MKIKHSALCILNNSCYSGYMIDILDNYFKISEALKLSKKSISTSDLYFISFIANQLQPDKEIKDLNYIISIIKKCSQYEKKEDFLYDIISDLYESLEKQYREKFDTKSNIKLDEISTDINMEHLINHITLSSKVGINSFHDLHDFYQFIYLFQSSYGQSNFQSILTKINSIIQIAQIIQNKIKCNNNNLFQIVKELIIQDKFFTNTLYERHPNHYIITSAHKEGLAPTFGTRKIGSDTKIILGSPAMSAFIIEALMFPKKDGISIKNIKRMAYETEDCYKEYAIQSNKRRKKWIRPYFTEWKSSSHTNKSYLNIDLDHTNIENIMKSVGFKLAIRFENDLETPVGIDPIDDENGVKSTEKYGFIIPPRKKREKRKRFRTIYKNIKSPFNGYTNIEEEEDLYYSDNGSEIENNTNEENNMKSSGFVLATINFDDKIDINMIKKFKIYIYTSNRFHN